MEVRNMFVLLLVIAVCCSSCYSQSTYRFTENNYDAYEESVVVKVVVERTGDTDDSGSVHITTLASTANSGVDYISVNRVLDFAAGGTRATVDITIIDDALDNEDETFIVRLSDPTGGTIGNPSDATIAIKDGKKPSEGLAEEILIAIIIACIAAVLILVVCCLLIYCLRFRGDVKDDVVYMRRPMPEALPEPYIPERYIPEPQPRPITPPTFIRPHTPPPQPRPRTPPPPQQPNTQVMVINEPSEPIVEPPPRKPTQVIVIRPQTPEIIRSRPRNEGQTEVIISRRRPRSASPTLEPSRYHDEDPLFIDNRPPSPVTIVRRVIRKPAPRPFTEADFDWLNRGSSNHGFNGGFGGRDALLNLPPGQGLYGPSNPTVLGRGPSPFGPGQSPLGAGPSSFGPGPSPFGPGPSPFGPGPSPFGPGPSSFGLGPRSFGPGPSPFGPALGPFGPQLPPSIGPSLPPAGFRSGFGPFPPTGFRPPPPRPGFYGPGF